MPSELHIKEVTQVRGEYQLKVSTLTQPLVITAELLEKHRLKEGVVITDGQLKQLQREAEEALCDRELGRLLAMRGHSVGEVRAKLARKKFGLNVIGRMVRKYIKQGLLDDAHFAHTYAKRLLERSPCGRGYLIAGLRRKLVDRALAEKVADALLSGHDEAELAMAALQKNWSRIGEFELETARRKAYNYLSRRGISYRAAKTAFETLYNAKRESRNDQDI
jgi:SOS response regulatory protein OraA/RecX